MTCQTQQPTGWVCLRQSNHSGPCAPRMVCQACGELLLPANALMDDGCPCNSERGVNFEPIACELCKTSNCVKPGHRGIPL